MKNSRFAEARDTVDKYIASINMAEVDIEERSRIVKRQVSVLKKQYDYAALGKVFLSEVEPLLKKACDSNLSETEARLLLTAQRISHYLQFKKDLVYIARMRDLRTASPESLAIAKYLVKVLL